MAKCEWEQTPTYRLGGIGARAASLDEMLRLRSAPHRSEDSSSLLLIFAYDDSRVDFVGSKPVAVGTADKAGVLVSPIE